MKARLQAPGSSVLLFSALLLTGSVVFVKILALGKPGTPARFTFTFSDDVQGGGCARNRVTERSTQVGIKPITLDLGFFFEEFGGECFTADSYSDVMAISSQKDGSAVATFYFDANTTTGEVIRYRLDMFGLFGGEWLPADGDSTAIYFSAWEMGTDTRGPRKNACRGAGIFDATAIVDRADGETCD